MVRGIINMIWPLFKANIKSNRFVWLLLTIIFCFYLFMIVVMYDPEGSEAMQEVLDMFPEELINALGFGNFGTTLIDYISSYIYGMLIFLFPMIVSIVINHRMFATLVDKGSMAYLLATPNSRKKIAITQALFSISSITLLFIVSTLFTIIFSLSIHPGSLNIGKFLLLNLYALLMYYTIGGIGFLGSSLANESKYSLGIGVGVPVGFYVIQMLSNIDTDISWIGNFTIYKLFSPEKMLDLNWFAFMGMGIFLVLGIGLYITSIYIFNKKNLYV